MIWRRVSGMKTFAKNMAAAFLLVSSSSVLADMLTEIQHLLQYLGNPACEFERNGTVYDSEEARAHIERKYNSVKSHVDETEDFIKYAATRSSLSGREYHVTCDGKKQTSAEWLHDELARFRNKTPGAVTLK
jgi:hypothetical protein